MGRTGNKKLLFEWKHTFMSEHGPEPTTRLVLCALSNHMNENGESCYPSIARLSMETGLNRNTVMRHLKKAVDDGWITRGIKGFSGQGWKRNEYKAAIPEKYQGGCTEQPRYAEGGCSELHKVVAQSNTSSTINSTVKDNSTVGGNNTPEPPPPGTTSKQSKKKGKAKPKTRKIPLPADFALTPALREFANDKGYKGDIDEFFEIFCNKCQADGRKQVDWPATFRTWLLKQIQWDRERVQEKNNGNNETKFKSYNKSRKGSSRGETFDGKYDGIGQELPAAG